MKKTRPGVDLLALIVVSLGVAGGNLQAAEYSAQVRYLPSLALSTSESGLVDRVLVRPGQRVPQDGLLLELDQRPYKARLQSAQARVKHTSEALAEARRELERTQEMYDRTLLSNHDLEVVKIALAEAQAEHESARAALALRRLEQEYSRIKAPLAARVDAVLGQPGQTLVQRCEAAPLIQLTPMHARLAVADVAVADGGDIQPGQAATVKQDQRSWPAEVYSVSRAPLGQDDQGNAGYRVAVSFAPQAEDAPQPGATVSIEIE